MPTDTYLCCWCDKRASHVLIKEARGPYSEQVDPACPTHVAMWVTSYDMWDAIALV